MPTTARRGEWLRAAALCLAVSLAAAVPFHLVGRPPASGAGATLRMPATHDIAMHFDHMRSFARGLAAGCLYPRWEEETNRGFGAPSTAFHPPALYYVTSLFHAAARNWSATFLLTHLWLFAASGMALYAYARRRLSQSAAAVAGAAYIVLPYHLVDLYQRGALAELLGFVWMPLVWLGIEAAFDARDRRARLAAMAALAAAYGAMLWSHPPTAFQFSLASGAFAAGLAFVRRSARPLATVGGALALGLLLSAAYFLPAVAEQGYVRNDVFRDRWAYGAHYVFSAPPPDAPAEFWLLIGRTWLFATVGSCAVAAALLAWSRRLSRGLREAAVIWTAAGVLVAFMMTPLASPLEPLVPGLAMSSFPWRMLGIATLVLALLLGAALDGRAALAGAGARPAARVLAAVALVVVAAAVPFGAVFVVAPAAERPAFVPRPDRPRANKYWVLPRWAPGDARTLPDWEPARVASGGGRLVIERWDPERRRLLADTPRADRLIVRTFDFPGWTATLDGRPAAIERGPFGNVELALPPGRHDVRLQFRHTAPRRLGAALSLAAVLALVGLVAASRLGRTAPEHGTYGRV